MKIKGEYITLQNYLKYNDYISSGAESKVYLLNNKVYVNKILETRRGKKCYPGDEIEINGNIDVIE